MASHHHHHGYCHPSTATTSTVCCCCPSYTTACHHCPPSDPHHLHHQLPSPTQPHLYSPCSSLPYATQCFHQQPTPYYPPPADLQREGYFRELHHQEQGGLSHAQPFVSSLLRRIAALESSLRHHSSSHSQSLRDAAARTIQTHFRAFLVRRSRALRQLKELASIKSTINILKLTVSDNNPLDPLELSHKALHLLLKLDSIQGNDPMIRDAKKSISRELTRFLDLIEGVTVKRPELSSGFIRRNARHGGSGKKPKDSHTDQKMGNGSCRDLGRDKKLEDLVNRIEALYNKVPREEGGEEDEELESPRVSLIRKNGVPQTIKGGFRGQPGGIQAKVKKNVKFSEDGNVYYVPRSRNELVLVEECDSDGGSDSLIAKKKLEDILQREAEEVGGNTSEDNEEAQSDGDDQISTKSSDDGERGPAFCAPLPVRMETRSDLMDKRKNVKVVE